MPREGKGRWEWLTHPAIRVQKQFRDLSLWERRALGGGDRDFPGRLQYALSCGHKGPMPALFPRL